MSETAQPGAEAMAAVDEGPSAGTLLRQAREAAGLHVATLAANLKVPVRKLEALEEDRYDLLPDAVFVRALASSVCRTLKVDARPVLARLPQTTQPRLVSASQGINAPFRAPGDARSGGWLAQLSRPAVLTVLALLIGALVIILLPAQRSGGGVAPSGAAAPDSVAALPSGGEPEALMPPPGAAAAVPAVPAPMEAVPPATSSAADPQRAAPGLPAAPAPDASTTTATPAAPAAGTTSASTSSSAAATAVAGRAGAGAPATATSSAGSGIVVFRTSGPSWVEVTDANGTTLLRRLLGAGEVAAASGALPLAVTVGSVAQTEVQVRGQPFDLAAVARDNVARFQVK